ncbi:hypothetical protein [Microvirus sp.]|nr:hypothetical protein [Microvirus sp.]
MNNRTKYYNALYSVDAKLLPSDKDILADVSPLNDAENNVLFPQDPTTGQLADLLSQVLKTENPLLRDSLMSKLETLPPNSSALNGVDDETKIQLLKPRSCQSLSEMADFTKYVESAIEQLNIDPSQVENGENQEQQEENPNPVSE